MNTSAYKDELFVTKARMRDLGLRREAPKPDMSMLSDPKGKRLGERRVGNQLFMLFFKISYITVCGSAAWLMGGESFRYEANCNARGTVVKH